MDNAAFHNHPLPQIGARRVTLPALSPELHKVVEHAIARIKQGFKRWLRDHPQSTSMHKAFAALHQIAQQQCSADIIKRDVDSLRDTYNAVLAASGDYPPKKFR